MFWTKWNQSKYVALTVLFAAAIAIPRLNAQTTDAQGRFTVVNLAVGEYEVQASKAGFATALRKGVTLTVGSQNTIDFSLPVGQASQTITVEAEVSPVETNSSSLSNLVREALSVNKFAASPWPGARSKDYNCRNVVFPFCKRLG